MTAEQFIVALQSSIASGHIKKDDNLVFNDNGRDCGLDYFFRLPQEKGDKRQGTVRLREDIY